MQPEWAPCASRMLWASSYSPGSCRVPKCGGRWNYGENTQGGDKTAAGGVICERCCSPAPMELSGSLVTDISQHKLRVSHPNPELLIIFSSHLLLIYTFHLEAKAASHTDWSNHSELRSRSTESRSRFLTSRTSALTRSCSPSRARFSLFGRNEELLSQNQQIFKECSLYTVIIPNSLARYGLWFLANGWVQRLEWLKQVKLTLAMSASLHPWLFLLLF